MGIAKVLERTLIFKAEKDAAARKIRATISRTMANMARPGQLDAADHGLLDEPVKR